MKYSTVFVPAVILANGLLAAAMPAPASPSSDMGTYKNRKPKQDTASAESPLSTGSLPSPPASALSVPSMASNRAKNVKSEEVTASLAMKSEESSASSTAKSEESSASSTAKSEESSASSTAKNEESRATGVPEMIEQVRSKIHARGPAPPTVLACGKLYVQSVDRYSGFVQGTRDRDGRYIVGPQSGAVTVKLNDHALELDQAFQGGYPRIGGTFGVDFERNPGADNMAGNSWNFAYVTATGDAHHYGQPAVMDRSTFNMAHDAHQNVESAVFYFGENGEIKAAWTNKNKQSVPIDFAVNPSKQLVLSANVGAYSAHYSFGSDAPAARVFCRA